MSSSNVSARNIFGDRIFTLFCDNFQSVKFAFINLIQNGLFFISVHTLENRAADDQNIEGQVGVENFDEMPMANNVIETAASDEGIIACEKGASNSQEPVDVDNNEEGAQCDKVAKKSVVNEPATCVERAEASNTLDTVSANEQLDNEESDQDDSIIYIGTYPAGKQI